MVVIVKLNCGLAILTMFSSCWGGGGGCFTGSRNGVVVDVYRNIIWLGGGGGGCFTGSRNGVVVDVYWNIWLGGGGCFTGSRYGVVVDVYWNIWLGGGGGGVASLDQETE